ncbi:MAG: hypothetical protein V1659_04230 [Candidatus Woesearchaeota archaeon]
MIATVDDLVERGTELSETGQRLRLDHTSFSGTDLLRAAQLYKQELVSPLDTETLFEAGLYCLLSQGLQHRQQFRIFSRLLHEGFGTPDGIKAGFVPLRIILSRVKYPIRLNNLVQAYASWWLHSSLPARIIEDAQGEKESGVTLRNMVAEQAPGLGLKCASLLMRMAGYLDVVPIDIWALRFLETTGYEFKTPEWKRIRGISKTEYSGAEAAFSEYALQNGFNPALLQLVEWCKASKIDFATQQLLFEGGALYD